MIFRDQTTLPFFACGGRDKIIPPVLPKIYGPQWPAGPGYRYSGPGAGFFTISTVLIFSGTYNRLT